MQLLVPPSMSVPITFASAHGFSDLQYGFKGLPWYTLALAPIPSIAVTPLFVGASVYHFSSDVGCVISLCLHAGWIYLAARNETRLAWLIFTVYYLVIHSAPRLLFWFARSPLQTLLFSSIATAYAILHTGPLVINDTMQKVAIAHILLTHFH